MRTSTAFSVIASAAAAVQPVEAAEGPFGTAHNVVMVAAAPDTSWLVYCQAREDTNGDGRVSVGVGYHGDLLGDRMVAWYAGPDGREVQLDDYVGADPSGRHVALIRHGRLLLIDTVSDAIVDLSASGADARDDINPLGGHRAAAFGDRHMLYLRERSVVVRDLATGKETQIDVGSGELFKAWIDEGWVVMLVVREDTDGNGKLEWPTVHTSLGARHCRGPISSFSTGGGAGDAPTRLFVPLTGGEPREVEGFVSAVDGDLLVRRSDGSLALTGIDAERELAPASCRGQVRGIDSLRGQVVAACSDSVVRLFWRGGWVDVGAESPVQHGDDVTTADRLLLLADGVLLDLETRSVVGNLRDEHYPILAADRALIHSGGLVVLRDFTKGESLSLGRSADDYFYYRRVGSVVAVDGYVVDMARFLKLGSYSGEALAVAKSGKVLLAAREPDARSFELPTGPLRWIDPR
jgi:hypothetical protein